MTTGRINQVAFLRDVGTAPRSTRRPCGARGGDGARASFDSRDEMRCTGRWGPGPLARGTFRIREHDRAPVLRGSPSGLRGHDRDTGHGVGSAPWPLGARDGRGTA